MTKEVGILLAVALAAALVVNAISPKGIPLFKKAGITDAGDALPGQGNELDAKAVKALFDTKAVLFVDARAEESFATGHIKGAASFPVGKFDEKVGWFFENHPPPQRIVTYCSGPHCSDSHKLARMFADMGYADVIIFPGGYPEWKKRGYPIEP